MSSALCACARSLGFLMGLVCMTRGYNNYLTLVLTETGCNMLRPSWRRHYNEDIRVSITRQTQCDAADGLWRNILQSCKIFCGIEYEP